MSGFLEAVRDNLEYLEDYQEVRANSGITSFSDNSFDKPWLFKKEELPLPDGPIKDVNTERLLLFGGIGLGVILIMSMVRRRR